MAQIYPSPSGERGSKDWQEGDGKFASLIQKAWKKWKHRGIIEIDERHRLYAISRCIQMGIRETVNTGATYEGEIKDLTEDDYLEVTTKTCFETNIKQRFEFRSYAPKVFTALRGLVGVTEMEYVESLVPSSSPDYCLEFITSSKSGMDFFLCTNKAFIMKTERFRDVCFLREHFLHHLVRHFQDFPHSLLVKIVGCYYIRIHGNKGVYFTVMQSVFYPDEGIAERYDLKGCSASRYVQPLEEGNKEVIVLKDNNFKGTHIDIGSQAPWFKKQVTIDSKFLENLGIMDYSLLVGIQKLHADEKMTTDKLADVVSRARRSIKSLSESPNRTCSQCGRKLPTWNRRSNIKVRQSNRQQHASTNESAETDRIVEEILNIEIDANDHRYASHSAGQSRSACDDILIEGSGPKKEGGVATKREVESNCLPGMLATGDGNQPSNVHQSEQGTSSLQPIEMPNSTRFCQCNTQFRIDTHDERNLRLLPNVANPLHIIDGENERYFIGIIDVLTQYRFKKKLEHLYKWLRYPTETFSTVKPEHYGQRFREYCYAKCKDRHLLNN